MPHRTGQCQRPRDERNPPNRQMTAWAATGPRPVRPASASIRQSMNPQATDYRRRMHVLVFQVPRSSTSPRQSRNCHRPAAHGTQPEDIRQDPPVTTSPRMNERTWQRRYVAPPSCPPWTGHAYSESGERHSVPPTENSSTAVRNKSTILGRHRFSLRLRSPCRSQFRHHTPDACPSQPTHDAQRPPHPTAKTPHNIRLHTGKTPPG